ncbi:hypothetical protein COU54_04085 [Candidatus Pacearchaeota archaeon CG10_big_fil_rev_8_21_14_0_10_31_24]|nr:MAG: hypothetical protein COU54_04085 [Candidatus Pacearchaeota archaeon CG10_big_fil_rev_8_21_14_0_10_31_24]
MEKEINYTIEAHTNYPKKTSKAFRKQDGKTPYAILTEDVERNYGKLNITRIARAIGGKDEHRK